MVYKLKENIIQLTHGVVSGRFRNSESENNTNYKNPDCIKFPVFTQR